MEQQNLYAHPSQRIKAKIPKGSLAAIALLSPFVAKGDTEMMIAKRTEVKLGRMKTVGFRHAVALAVLAWYVMTPPWSLDPQLRIDESAPLRNWSVGEAMDTRNDCETLRQRIIEPHTPPRGGTVVMERQIQKLSKASRCVAGDDPRLYGN
jgi:hypothetical protein